MSGELLHIIVLFCFLILYLGNCTDSNKTVFVITFVDIQWLKHKIWAEALLCSLGTPISRTGAFLYNWWPISLTSVLHEREKDNYSNCGSVFQIISKCILIHICVRNTSETR